jgi:arylsulfatase A
VQREHHANVTQMDHAFGTLISALDELKLSQDTLIFFTSDNGPEGDGVTSAGRGSSGGLRGRKRDMHEGGIRVPGIARWPGKIQPGTTCSTPVIGSDVFPTMLTAAGVSLPTDRPLDGINVLPLLTGQTQSLPRPQPLYWRLLMAPNAKMAMRVDDWKILANAEQTEFELYNLKADEKETQDLKDKETAIFAKLKEQLKGHTAAIDAESPDWWKRLSPSGGTDPSKAKAKGKGKGKSKD